MVVSIAISLATKSHPHIPRMDTDLTEEQMSSVCQRKLRREVIGPPLKKWKIADWEGWLIAAIPDDIKITERERQRPL